MWRRRHWPDATQRPSHSHAQLSVHRNSHAELDVDPANAGCQAPQRRRDVHWGVGGAAGSVVNAHAYVRSTHPLSFGRAGQPQDVRAALSRRGRQELNTALSVVTLSTRPTCCFRTWQHRAHLRRSIGHICGMQTKTDHVSSYLPLTRLQIALHRDARSSASLCAPLQHHTKYAVHDLAHRKLHIQSTLLCARREGLRNERTRHGGQFCCHTPYTEFGYIFV